MSATTIDKSKNVVGNPPVPNTLRILTVLTVLGLALTLYLGLFFVGTDVLQGEVQRIFYIHMPAFFGSMTALGATVFGGIMYLVKRDAKWDRLALAGVEVGLALGTITLLTGVAWMRPIWNAWWLWDPRLTSAAIMVLTYAAYLMLRAGIENVETRRRFASVYGILAYTTVILTLVIIRIRPDTIHPAVIGPSPQSAQGDFEATTGVVTALVPALIFYATIFPLTLMWWRIRLQNMLDSLEQQKIRLLNS